MRTLYGKLELLLSVLLLAALMLALYGTFLVAPKERTMGNVQRIFYFHVPSAMLAFLSFAVVFVASVGYLKTRKRTWDLLARSSAVCVCVMGQGGILPDGSYAHGKRSQRKPGLNTIQALAARRQRADQPTLLREV